MKASDLFEAALAREFTGAASIPHTNVIGRWMNDLMNGRPMPDPQTDVER